MELLAPSCTPRGRARRRWPADLLVALALAGCSAGNVISSGGPPSSAPVQPTAVITGSTPTPAPAPLPSPTAGPSPVESAYSPATPLDPAAAQIIWRAPGLTLYVTEDHLCALPADGPPLYIGPYEETPVPTRLAVSDDLAMIAFTRRVPPEPGDPPPLHLPFGSEQGVYELWVARLDGSGGRRLLEPGYAAPRLPDPDLQNLAEGNVMTIPG